MVDVGFDGNGETIVCEGCGVELPVFLDVCPYCDSDDASDDTDEVEAPCPSCGAMIYDDSVRCAICGTYVTMKAESKGVLSAKKAKLIIVVIMIVAILYSITL